MKFLLQQFEEKQIELIVDIRKDIREFIADINKGGALFRNEVSSIIVYFWNNIGLNEGYYNGVLGLKNSNFSFRGSTVPYLPLEDQPFIHYCLLGSFCYFRCIHKGSRYTCIMFVFGMPTSVLRWKHQFPSDMIFFFFCGWGFYSGFHISVLRWFQIWKPFFSSSS